MGDSRDFETQTPSQSYVETMSNQVAEKTTLDWDLKKMEEIDLKSFSLPDPWERNIFKDYAMAIKDGQKDIEDPAYALLNLARRIKLEDGKPLKVLDEFGELVKIKGERLGFLVAMIFLNSSQGFEKEDGSLEKGNVVSSDLQERMLNYIESYLLSVSDINEENHDLLRNDLLNLGMVVDRSVVDMSDDLLDANDIEKMRQKGNPASDDTYLNVDNTFRLLRIVDDFGRKEVVKENTFIEAKVQMILDKKRFLEDKGLSL